MTYRFLARRFYYIFNTTVKLTKDRKNMARKKYWTPRKVAIIAALSGIVVTSIGVGIYYGFSNPFYIKVKIAPLINPNKAN
jgi:hypothetical protein